MGKFSDGSSYAEHSIDHAAEGIFDMLPDDPFEDGGKEDEEKPTGESSDQETDAGDEEDFDDEATSALEDEDEEEEPESEDEDEGEDEEEEGTESEDDEELEDEAEEDDDPMVSVKVDGETIEMPQSEALAGYSRTASWTKKSQALAEERKAFDAERAEVQRERMDYGERLQSLEEQLGVNLTGMQEPNPQDPKYERKWIEFQQERQKLATVQQERYNLQQQMEAEYNRERDALIESENEKLVEAIPEWTDSEVAMSDKKSLAKYAIRLGFDEDDVEKLIDHRLVLLLRKGMAHDSMSEAKGKVKKKMRKAPVLKPGQTNRKSSRGAKKSKRAAATKRDRLRKEGSVHAAADFIYDTLGDED